MSSFCTLRAFNNTSPVVGGRIGSLKEPLKMLKTFPAVTGIALKLSDVLVKLKELLSARVLVRLDCALESRSNAVCKRNGIDVENVALGECCLILTAKLEYIALWEYILAIDTASLKIPLGDDSLASIGAALNIALPDILPNI
tara:strand:- start:42363 stop:42791 length:429 start_codon:yes stop_codon:yes gene_type:complete